MGPGMLRGLDVLIRFGIFGMIVAAGSVVVGIPLVIWWLINHVRFQ
jgi:hypothetical protein